MLLLHLYYYYLAALKVVLSLQYRFQLQFTKGPTGVCGFYKGLRISLL